MTINIMYRIFTRNVQETTMSRATRVAIFSDAEYSQRVAELRRRMAERQLDAVVITQPDNFLYLTNHQTTGYGTLQALVIPVDAEPFSVTRILEESNIIARTWVQKRITYADTDKPVGALASSLIDTGLGSGRIGIERDGYFLPAPAQEQLSALLGDAELVNCSGITEEGRVVKSDAEVELMRQVAKITEAGMIAGIETTRVGVTENEIAGEIYRAMCCAGGEYPAVAPYVTSGPRTIIGHATWEGHVVRDGDMVFLELAGCLRRYHTAMMRTLVMGPPRDEILAAEELVNKAVSECIAAMKPGVPVGSIDDLSREILADNSIGATQVSRAGYSIGIAFAPSWDEGHILSIKGGEQRPLEKNMTFHLIPWLQLPELKMVMGLSETVVITEKGAESLFTLPRQVTVKLTPAEV